MKVRRIGEKSSPIKRRTGIVAPETFYVKTKYADRIIQ